MNQPNTALEATGLGKRYRRGWALQDCSFTLPVETMVALVGPNGAGKSTLMALATGILAPTTGVVKVSGDSIRHRGPHPKLAFLSQDRPLYKRFTVEEMLHFGRSMNDHFDDHYARRLITESDIPLTARTGALSGGQRTRLALALTLGRRPAVLLLDEPLAALDPLARTQVMQTLMAEVVDSGITVVMSSHVIADIEDAAEHLLLLTGGRIRLDGRVADLLAEHWIAAGPVDDDRDWIATGSLVESRATARQVTTMVRDRELRAPDRWTQDNPTLQELVLAYLRADGSGSPLDMGPKDMGPKELGPKELGPKEMGTVS
jgi:ABC-2 type transport system ATP-binding protein